MAPDENFETFFCSSHGVKWKLISLLYFDVKPSDCNFSKKALRLRQFDVCVRPKLLTPSQLKRPGKLLNLVFKGRERESE